MTDTCCILAAEVAVPGTGSPAGTVDLDNEADRE
jgi:hypothetical protein